MKKSYRDARTEVVNFEAQDWILTSEEGSSCPYNEGGCREAYCSIVYCGNCQTVEGTCDEYYCQHFNYGWL